ncbi:MAG: sugar ABC transporter ATP-binding protein [Candidatus Aminicenantes bacterium]|nr:sugar ABC transporter ATP-binding protein [Candidatus Aminicenantes bacterium]
MAAPVLEARKISKRFPGALALDRADLQVHGGEVLALVGENGAGKSTLVKILAGEESPDSGRILMDGSSVRMESVQTATGLGVILIHQELNLSDNLDVTANIFLGREPHRFGFLNHRRLARAARPILGRIGLDCSPSTKVARLSMGQRQLVEIARALAARSRVLIMDEPTSSLSQGETRNLFRTVRELRGEGVAVIYISHRLGEVKELADRVLVLRDGANAGELAKDEIDHDRMVRLMVGRDISGFYGRVPGRQGPVRIEVRDLRTRDYPGHRLDLEVGAGEIVGLAGLLGSGRSALLGALFGTEPGLGGSVRIDGATARISNPIEGIRNGIALVPEDRKQQGLILRMGVEENVSLASLRLHRLRGGFINRRLHRRQTARMIARLGIRTPGAETTTEHLSGGNQQKVVLAKWLSLKPKVLLLDEPTRGIDVGSKQEIYLLIEALSEQGTAILFASSEMEEILRLSRRVLVMHEGRISGQLSQGELTEEAVAHLATSPEEAA